MHDEVADVASRVRGFITARYGRVDEKLMASGIIDSLRAVELAMALEKEFGLPPDSFALSDLITLTSLSNRIVAALRSARP